MAEFKIGDTVRLKSGGPLMTVTQAGNSSGTPHVWTVWFDASGKEAKGFYPQAAVEADSGGPVIA